MTLEEARAELRASLDEGTTCPCCGKFVKRMRIAVHGTLAAWLVALVRLSDQGRVSIEASKASALVVKPGKSAVGYSYLVHWDLVTPDASKETPEGARPGKTGYWSPTERGIEFANGRTTIPKRAVLLNNVLEGFEGGRVTIQQALGSKFDYEELMAARPLEPATL